MNNRNIFAAATVAALLALPTASQARVVDGVHHRHHHAERIITPAWPWLHAAATVSQVC